MEDTQSLISRELKALYEANKYEGRDFNGDRYWVAIGENKDGGYWVSVVATPSYGGDPEHTVGSDKDECVNTAISKAFANARYERRQHIRGHMCRWKNGWQIEQPGDRA